MISKSESLFTWSLYENNDFLKFMVFFGTGAGYSCGGRINIGISRNKIIFSMKFLLICFP
jgi:hypothetical protein